jgi:signal transduction histidine kinase/DNA-binding response OmpR family regulator
MRLSTAGSRLREAALTGLSIFSVAATGLVFTYRTAQEAPLDQIRSQIRQNATLVANQIESRLHASLTRTEQMDSADYRRTAIPLLQISRSVPQLYYAHTMTPGPKGPRLVVDSSRFVRNSGDTTSVAGIGELYDDAPTAAREALGSGEATLSRDPYTDRWGTFLSSFAPFRDGSGRIAGVVGIDICLAHLHGYLQPLRLSLALVGSALLAALSAQGRWRSLQTQARAIEEVTRSRELAEQAAAEAASRARSTFLATVSHEIRTPLNAVIGLTTIVLDSQLSERQRECLDTVRTSAQSLLTILNDILDFSAIDAGSLRLCQETSTLRPLLEEVIDLCAPQAHERALELTLIIADGVPERIETDALRLRQILLNLVNNAVKFTQQGEVELSVIGVHEPTDQARLEFAVRDTGPGIPPAERERLFLPFDRLETSDSPQPSGSGLGLAISQRLAQALGGALEVDSEAGEGTRLVLSLPLILPKEGAPGDVSLRELSQPVAEGIQFLARRNLLVVSASEPNRRVLRTEIEREGGTARLASNRSELETLLDGNRFDLAIIDRPVTPSPGGFPGDDANGVILGHRHGADLPLVVCDSLQGEPPTASGGILLRKPIKQASLRQALRTALCRQTDTTTTLPVAMAAQDEVPAPGDDFARLHPLRILVAEDNIVNRRVCDLMLRRLGYSAEFVDDGIEVVEVQRRLDPDVILMDLSMPGLDGLTATRRIRSHQPKPHRPWIVAVTSHAMPGDRSLAFESGMDDFLSKPIDESALVKALKRGHAALSR